YHSIILSFYHSIIQSFNHSIILSFNHSSNLSFYHSIIQAIKRRYPIFITIYPFYKRSLKNPLLFIIPSFILPFINPHHLFQPFDSISPIFKISGAYRVKFNTRRR
ncbi:hypothetical protein HMPREF1431_01644, partial [Helicobacter pylori GAMchJs106B]